VTTAILLAVAVVLLVIHSRDYLRHGSRPLELERRSCELVELVRRASDANQRISAGRVIRVESAERTLTGLWDPLRLERVIDNLLSNAVKFSRDGGRVRVRLNGDGTNARLVVMDCGHLSNLEEPHVFTEHVRRFLVGDTAETA